MRGNPKNAQAQQERPARQYALEQAQGARGGPGMGGGPRGPGGPGGPGGGPGGRAFLYEKPKDAKNTLRRLVRTLQGQRGAFTLLFFLCVVNALINVVTPVMIGSIMDDYVAYKDVSGLLHMCLYLLGVYLVGVGALHAQQRLMVRVAQRTTAKIRADLYGSLSALPLRYFDTHSSGDIMSRLSNDVDTIGMTLSQNTAQLLSGVVTLVGILAAMLILNPLLTLFSLTILPLTFLIVRSIAKVARNFFRAQQKDLGNLNGFVEEMVSGQKEIKLFSREGQITREFYEFNEKLRRSGTLAQSVSGLMGPMMNMTNNLSYLVAAVGGSYLIVSGGVSIGTVFSFLQYMRKISQPLSSMANLFNTLQSALAASERVFAVMDEQPERDAPGAVDIGEIEGGIRFENVTFSYDGTAPVLKNATIEARPGEQVAIVGPTGAGKTTIISLLMRFYEPGSGEIHVDGRGMEEITRRSLRKNVGMVLQDTYLFSETVRDNIRYGRPEASDAEVVAAAKTANAHSFIMHLPQGYDTVLADNGSDLSQGQRQLLAIARAVLANPRMLILDEATSSIDTRTELMIQNAMLALMKGRTSFIIAHRLSTIRNADKILVVSGGEIVEAGTHAQLLEKPGGFYAHLYNSQFKTGMAL